MKLNSSKLFFLAFMIVGVMMCLSSNNWIMIWCGLEMTIISFLPIISSKLIITSESSIIYFLIQSISSSLLMLGLMMMLTSTNLSELIITLSLVVKMGVAPFHIWVLKIIDGMSFYCNILLLTVLKLPPLMLMSYMSISVSIIILVTFLVGSILGLNQSSTRKIMTYSSIFNIGLVLTMMKNNNSWIIYFMIYSLLVVILLTMFSQISANYINQIVLIDKPMMTSTNLWFLLLSLGGLPPFMGFSIKLMTIEFMILSNMFMSLTVMILCSLLVMFFYMRMTYMSIMFFSIKSKTLTSFKNSIPSNIFFMNLTILPLILTFKSFS